jgi:hypothetical protein
LKELLRELHNYVMIVNMGYDTNLKKENLTGNQSSTMRCIQCNICGEKILMVPTLEKMIEAIENHIDTHRKQSGSELTEDEISPADIRTNLTHQVLDQASKMLEDYQKQLPWLETE